MSAETPCLFCLIVAGPYKIGTVAPFSQSAGKVPCFKIHETELTLAFLDISPVSDGHTLVIPKVHGRTLLDVPEENLRDIGPVLQLVARATGAKDFNVLQNNGKLAFQHVDHVHFHVAPKPNEEEGVRLKLGETFIQKHPSKEQLAAIAGEMKERIKQ